VNSSAPGSATGTPLRQALRAALGRLKQGDRAAADEVFALAWPAMKRFASLWLAGSPNAEDAAQRALVRVFEQALHYDQARDALAWALELTVWECRTERARMRRARVDDAPSSAERSTSAPLPDEQLEAAQLRAALTQALGGLSATDQAELALLLDGAAAGDAAQRKRRQRALERLRALWRTLHGE
jgi:RNA polymerase sigma-70 factor (ECF subfamily)